MVIRKIFNFLLGNTDGQRISRYRRTINKINAYEETVRKLSHEELLKQTEKFRHHLHQQKGSVEAILPEAFATVREAAVRAIGQRHFDVQIMGAMALHEGFIAEMQTGEGKTLAATMAAYLQALISPGVQIITVNDYLAKRDAQWMGAIYRLLGLSTGYLENSMADTERLKQYGSDIIYGSNNEFSFDFLRNNLQYDEKKILPQNFNYAIIDEVDSILIDEARTPLVISSTIDIDEKIYTNMQNIINKAKPEYYQVSEEKSLITLTDNGIVFFEQELRKAGMLDNQQLYDSHNIEIIHYLNQALRANLLIKKDKDYVVRNGEALVVDEFTGRIMTGRRYGNGLHQALEAKERLRINPENQPIASITLQNFFRYYKKLAGMTGTAKTEAEELKEVYNLEVVTIPTNKPMCRKDLDDEVFLNKKDKLSNIVSRIKEIHATGQPLLVGTSSVASSEELSALLNKEKLKHSILNARNHALEAQIINNAGRLNQITVTTNMAGRGTDIQLGGNLEVLVQEELNKKGSKDVESIRLKIGKQVQDEHDKVVNLGGLYVIGTERHESRRIDNQLRGRSGRQGDPGTSKFYISLEDDLLRIFGSDRLQDFLGSMGMNKGESITSPFLTKTITKAQEKVEGMNQDARKSLLQYDNVLDEQRRIIYEYRYKVLTGQNLTTADEIVQESVSSIISNVITEDMYADQWDAEELSKAIKKIWPNHNLPIASWIKEIDISLPEIQHRIVQAVQSTIDENLKETGDKKPLFLRVWLLQAIDNQWRHHLSNMSHLRQAIGLRGYAQKNPLHEYKKEALALFDNLILDIGYDYVRIKLHAKHEAQKPVTEEIAGARGMPQAFGNNCNLVLPREHFTEPEKARNPAYTATMEANMRRNTPCYCGSGKKYKHCHGKIM